MFKEFVINNCTALVSTMSVIVTLLIFIITNKKNQKHRIIEVFNEIYSKTFALRSEISKKYGEFHYELDTILNDEYVNIKVLDYLTEIENLSLSVMEDSFWYRIINKSTHNSDFIKKRVDSHYLKLFTKLSSPELYKRLICLFPFIMYQRQKTNNAELFSNYVRFANQIRKIKIHNNKNTVYVYSGIRHSDIDETNYFDETICLFDEKYDNSFKDFRANQNIMQYEFTNFFATRYADLNKKILQGKKKKKDIVANNYEIMLYNQKSVYELPRSIAKHVCCYNSKDILNILNDKQQMRAFLAKNRINIVPFIVKNGENIDYDTLKQLLNGNKFIIQSTFGGGGIGTFLADENNFTEIKEKIITGSQYIISNYLENSISVNTHVFIASKSTVVTPASVQLIENINNQLVYRGADFIAFRDLEKVVQEKIRETSIVISNLLRKMGYRGVAGIDFIVDKTNQIYCCEINPRFQSSSVLLNKFIVDREKSREKNSSYIEETSIYEMNKNAFKDTLKSSISFYDEVNYSCYFYYNDANMSKDDIKERIKSLEHSNTKVNLDSLLEYGKEQINAKSYLFNVIFNRKISQISPDHSLWINDNIRFVNAPSNMLDIKIALVNQGVRIDERTINENDNIKAAVYGGIDFYLEKYDIYINSPVNTGLSSFSPFIIKKIDEEYYLYYLSMKISRITIEKQQIKNSVTSQYLKDIIYISTDRMRVKLINGCDYKSHGQGCLFCSVPYSRRHYSLSQLQTALQESMRFSFRHILIGGGTDLSEFSTQHLINVVKTIRKNIPDKPISLMSIPMSPDIMTELKENGLTEVAYNLEVYDDEIAAKYMPGKRNGNTQWYLSSLKNAVSIFGNNNVRSALIVGLEPTDSLIKAVEKLCEIQVIPCLSVYRTITNSENSLNPTNEYLKVIYNRSVEIAGKYNMFIGPKCEYCRNNMLVI